MPNIKTFRLVVHEKKIFEDLTKVSLFCPLLGPKRVQPLYLNKSESPSLNHAYHQVWLKLAEWFVRRSRLNEKVNRRTDGRTDAGKIAFGSGELIKRIDRR